MAHLIVRGGSFGCTVGWYPEGVHEIEDSLVDALELATADVSWANVERHYDAPLQLTTGEAEEPQPAVPTPGEALVASTDNDKFTQTAAGKIEEAKTPEPEKPAPGFPCPFCPADKPKNLRNEGARISHVKAKHPEQAEAFMAERREAREAGEHGWGANAEE